ncbi:MAG: FHA domain-containing protein [Planctomycetes bacterium]|nr:FHA domain-containing protein [Planctomycetota bacterium]
MGRLHAKLTLLGKHPQEVPVRTSPFILGRSEQCHLALEGGGKVSRQHAEITFQKGKFHIVDLGSHNGTRVNGEKITEAVLDDGDRITIGGFEIQVSIAIEDQDGKSLKPPRNKPAAGKAPAAASGGHGAVGKSGRPAPAAAAAPVVVVAAPAPPPEEEGTKFIDMNQVVGPPIGEGGTAIVRMHEITGVRRKPPSKALFAVGAVAVVLIGSILGLKVTGVLDAPPDLSFAEVCALIQAKEAGQPIPENVKLPDIERMLDTQLPKGLTAERPLVFSITNFGSTDPKVFQVSPIGQQDEGGPEKLSLMGMAPGKALLVMVDRETQRWFSIGVEVLADSKWPPNWTDLERRSAAEKLKADADLLYEDAKGDVTDRAKALSRYQKVVRMYDSMASPPPKPYKEAKDRAEEILKQVNLMEENLMKEYRANLGRKKWEEMREIVIKLLDIFPVEGSSTGDEVFGRHGNWDKFNTYKSEKTRVEWILRRIDPRRKFN